MYPYDPEAAKKILQDKDLSGASFEIATNNITIYTKIAEVLQQQLDAVGIKASVAPMPAPEMVEKFSINRTTPMMTTVSSGLNDPSAVLQLLITPNALLNPGGLPNADIMKFGAEAAATLDPVKSKKAYGDLADAWIENPPGTIPICEVHQISAFSSVNASPELIKAGERGQARASKGSARHVAVFADGWRRSLHHRKTCVRLHRLERAAWFWRLSSMMTSTRRSRASSIARTGLDPLFGCEGLSLPV